MTLQDLEQMTYAELIEVCDTDPAHIATARPTYDQLIRGAQFTNEHRADTRNWWNEYFSDEAVKVRQQTNELRAG